MRFATQFAGRLHDYRQAAGLTEAELGDRLNVHQVTVSRWEKGTREPSFSQMEDIADALGVQVWRFFAPVAVIKLVEWAESHLLGFLSEPEVQELRATGTDGRRFTSEEEGNDAQGKYNSHVIWARKARARIISLASFRRRRASGAA